MYPQQNRSELRGSTAYTVLADTERLALHHQMWRNLALECVRVQKGIRQASHVKRE
jgi:hypothetical protein